MKSSRLAFFLFAGLIGCSSASQTASTDEDDTGVVAPDDSGVDGAPGDSAAGMDSTADSASGTDSGSSSDVMLEDAPSTSPATKLVVEPDDGSTPILAAIDGAKKSVHLEIYLLTDYSAINALKSAKGRGVDVQVVLEKNPYGMSGANDSAQSQLTAAGIPVHWANNSLYTLTHAKFMVIDGATLVVMTLNLSASAFTSNREYAVFDTDAGDVAEAEAMWEADSSGKSYLPVGALVVSPNNSEKTLEGLIDSAKSTLDVEIETLGDSHIDDHIIAAAGRGVVVRILVADETSSTTASSVASLGAKGIKVRKLTTKLTVHAKAVVVDGARAYIGSENFTTQSLMYNREVGLITSTASIVTRVGTTVAGDWAKGVAY